MNKCPKIVKKWRRVKVKNSEILNRQGRAILLDVYGRRQLQVCQNPDLLWRLLVVAGSKAQEERDGGRLSAGGEIDVIADGDGEQEKEVWELSAGREVSNVVA